MSHSPEGELLSWDNKELSEHLEPWHLHGNFEVFFLKRGFKTISRHLHLLLSKRILMKPPWVMRLSPAVLSCRDCFCCLVVSGATAVFIFGICRERRSEKEVNFTLEIPLPAK